MLRFSLGAGLKASPAVVCGGGACGAAPAAGPAPSRGVNTCNGTIMAVLLVVRNTAIVVELAQKILNEVRSWIGSSVFLALTLGPVMRSAGGAGQGRSSGWKARVLPRAAIR